MANDLIAAGGWVFSVVTALVAYKAATRTYSDTSKDSDKNVYVTAVTNERAKWRDDFRKSVARFSRLSIEPVTNFPELLETKANIVLRLNPKAKDPKLSKKHKFDLQIMNSVNAAFDALSTGQTKDAAMHVANLEVAAQELLKQEWEKSKAEALSGRSRTPPAG